MAQTHELDQTPNTEDQMEEGRDLSQLNEPNNGHLSDEPHKSKLVRFYAHPWTQIILISFICFCLPGVSINWCKLCASQLPKTNIQL